MKNEKMTEKEKLKIRQPIVTVCGHVDHGKTSLLDNFRGSSIHEKEAGGITQKISFTVYPSNQLKKACPLIEKNNINLEIPGFLFIDTPGHAAFTNLRKRGGSLADIAILVIDINEGIKPQTSETIQILKTNKVPFVVALNKIDKIHGWKKGKDEIPLKDRISSQPKNTLNDFNEKYLTIVGSLQAHGFDSDLFYNVTDFTKKISLVPCSAKTGEGIQELLLILCGLSQKYLKERLKLGKDAKGVILEIKKEQTNYVEAIIYDGTLSKEDEIAISNIYGEPIITKIRVLEEILPLSFKFIPREKVNAATGIRMQLVEKEEILPGMPFLKYNNNKEEIKNLFKKQISEAIKTDKEGIIVKADSLGSLEALISILHQENFKILKAGIGNINKSDVVMAKANLKINELNAVILGFNVNIDQDVLETKGNITILTDEVIYRVIEKLKEFRKEKAREIEKRRLLSLSPIAKLKILHQFVFRNSNPAIFGVKIESGKIIPGLELINEKNEKIGKIKAIQSEGKQVNEAIETQEVAISVPGVNFERKLSKENFLYSNLSNEQIKNLMKNKDVLSESEIKSLQEIINIKEKTS
ncbi:MAG: translation initiation factor aIF-2 [Candidatus Pacearchaeota archaeon]|nr:MAG: translation initiation factor aIF-2 [Candidatus Pacearchaeota archaeon]